MRFIDHFWEFIFKLFAYLFKSDVVPQVSQSEIIVDEEKCHGCQRTKDKNGNLLDLIPCIDCRVVKFCSVKCKSENRSAHKIDCRKGEIKILSDRVKKLTLKLQNFSEFAGEPPQNYFETQIGLFGDLMETSDYFRTKHKLANELYRNGFEENSKDSYKAALSHYLELLRLSSWDKVGIRFIVPLALLNLDRDQDAHDFIKWWLIVAPGHDWSNPPSSREGDWIYLRNQNIFEDLSSAIGDGLQNQHFAASLAIIKSRIVTNFRFDWETWNVFKACLEVGDVTCGKLFSTDLAMENIEKFVFNVDDDELREQGRHLRRYLRRIDRYILEGIVFETYGYGPYPPEKLSSDESDTDDNFFKDSKSLFQNNELAKKEIRKIIYGTGRIRKKKKKNRRIEELD